jgi:acetyl esterase/lipase
MDLMDRMDTELIAAYGKVPPEGFIRWDNLPSTREFYRKMFRKMTADIPNSERVIREDLEVPGPMGAPQVPVRVYRPSGLPEDSGALPGVLWMHGGGYVIGSVEEDDLIAQHVCEEVGCVVVSVEYRLAPEHPFPAALEDCYAALEWMADDASELGVDTARIAITGPSAGGGLTAGLALLARDRGEISVAFQAPIYPMIDDRNDTPSGYENADSRLWGRRYNENGWKAYTGTGTGERSVSQYAAPTRAAELSGLPPAYIAVGALDIFLDEDIEYARRLMRAGVATELRVYPGLFHGSDIFAPTAVSSRRFIADRDEALRRALHPRTSLSSRA